MGHITPLKLDIHCLPYALRCTQQSPILLAQEVDALVIGFAC